MRLTTRQLACLSAFTAFAVGAAAPAAAQQKTKIEQTVQDIESKAITGEIFDEEGEPLIGAS